METTLGSPSQNESQNVAMAPRRAVKFTRENARYFSQRGNEALKRMREEHKRLLAEEKRNAVACPDGEYLKARVQRTREQIEMIDAKLERARDAKDIKFLADSLARLHEVERILSGRPAPGLRRPAPERRSTSNTSQIEPLD